MASFPQSALVRELANTHGLSQAQVKSLLDTAFARIGEEAEAGNRVQIAGFGKFETKTRAARMGRNPATGEAIQIPEKRVLTFKPAS